MGFSGNDKTRFKMARFKRDYNRLEVGQGLVFFYAAARSPSRLCETLARRNLFPDSDYSFKYYPVLGNQALSYLGSAPVGRLEKSEFFQYANSSTTVNPDTRHHPNLSEFDMAVPRVSNKHLASDTLPAVNGLYQVYIQKLSRREID
jgi:hypothetical protein